MNCDSIREVLEAYALDALEPAERAAVAQHLADCPDCQRVLDGYREIIAALPEALAAVSPHRVPASLRARLLQTIAGEQDENDAGSPTRSNLAGSTGAVAAPRVTSNDAPSNDVTSNDASTPRTATPRPPNFAFWTAHVRRLRFALIGLSILLVLMLIWSIRLNASLARERALRAEFADLVEQQEIVLEVVDSDKTVRRVLLQPERTSELPPYGKLFTRTDMIHVVAMAARLDPPPPGQAYHLWLTRAGETELAGLFRVNDDGFGLLVFDAEQANPAYDAAWLTLQPTGSDTPQGEAIIRWEASS